MQTLCSVDVIEYLPVSLIVRIGNVSIFYSLSSDNTIN